MKSYAPSEKSGGGTLKELDYDNKAIFADSIMTGTYTVPSDGIISIENNGVPEGITFTINGNTVTGYVNGNGFRALTLYVSSGDYLTFTSTNNSWTWKNVFYPFAS